MVSIFNSSTSKCIIIVLCFKFQVLISMYVQEMTGNCFISFNLEIEYLVKVDTFCKVQLGYVPYIYSTGSDDGIPSKRISYYGLDNIFRKRSTLKDNMWRSTFFFSFYITCSEGSSELSDQNLSIVCRRCRCTGIVVVKFSHFLLLESKCNQYCLY